MKATLFLDEVGDLPLELQPKLLRALEEKSFERLGGNRTIAIDVRLIAATNQNLAEEVRSRRFRNDLYYRLSVFTVLIPALRERREDIPALADHFMRIFNRQEGKQIRTIPANAIRRLASWDWPGNVRELENVIHRSVVLTEGPELQLSFPATIE